MAKKYQWRSWQKVLAIVLSIALCFTMTTLSSVSKAYAGDSGSSTQSTKCEECGGKDGSHYSTCSQYTEICKDCGAILKAPGGVKGEHNTKCKQYSWPTELKIETKYTAVYNEGGWKISLPSSWKYEGITLDMAKDKVSVDFSTIIKTVVKNFVAKSAWEQPVMLLVDMFLPSLFFDSSGNTATVTDTQKILNAIQAVSDEIGELKDTVVEMGEKTIEAVKTQTTLTTQEQAYVNALIDSMNKFNDFKPSAQMAQDLLDALKKRDDDQNLNIVQKRNYRIYNLTYGLGFDAEHMSYSDLSIMGNIDSFENGLFNFLTSQIAVPNGVGSWKQMTYQEIIKESLRYTNLWEEQSYDEYDAVVAPIIAYYYNIYTLRSLSLQARLEAISRGEMALVKDDGLSDTKTVYGDSVVVGNMLESLTTKGINPYTGESGDHLEIINNVYYEHEQARRDELESKQLNHLWVRGGYQTAVDCYYDRGIHMANNDLTFNGVPVNSEEITPNRLLTKMIWASTEKKKTLTDTGYENLKTTYSQFKSGGGGAEWGNDEGTTVRSYHLPSDDVNIKNRISPSINYWEFKTVCLRENIHKNAYDLVSQLFYGEDYIAGIKEKKPLKFSKIGDFQAAANNWNTANENKDGKGINAADVIANTTWRGPQDVMDTSKADSRFVWGPDDSTKKGFDFNKSKSNNWLAYTPYYSYISMKYIKGGAISDGDVTKIANQGNICTINTYHANNFSDDYCFVDDNVAVSDMYTVLKGQTNSRIDYNKISSWGAKTGAEGFGWGGGILDHDMSGDWDGEIKSVSDGFMQGSHTEWEFTVKIAPVKFTKDYIKDDHTVKWYITQV